MRAEIITEKEVFYSAKEKYREIEAMLESEEMKKKEHAEIEIYLKAEGFELLRRMMQGYLDMRSEKEKRRKVIDANEVERTRARATARPIETLFGRVDLDRLGYSYSKKGIKSLYPLDGELNLAKDIYSAGTSRLVAEQSSKESFDEVVKTVSNLSGARVAKRQVEELAQKAAVDFDSFYEERTNKATQQEDETSPLLVIQTDAKGVVMRTQDLREVTRKSAEVNSKKMSKRLSRGEKANRKRMAQVASVYTIAPYQRTPQQIVYQFQPLHQAQTQRPKPEHKRVWASLEHSAQEVIESAFEEALSRDRERKKTWVAVVDGNETQLDLLEAYSIKYKINLIIVLDIIHVIEYLWKASYVFNPRESQQAQDWVSERLLEILKGNSSLVAGGIRRSATLRGLIGKQREQADECADYLIKYAIYLRYNQYLALGLPIASGVIEGACRHLVKDRMDLTGARWGLKSAEAILKLRSLRSSGDFDEYWQFHLQKQLQRNHLSNYFNGSLPPQPSHQSHLQLLK